MKSLCIIFWELTVQRKSCDMEALLNWGFSSQMTMASVLLDKIKANQQKTNHDKSDGWNIQGYLWGDKNILKQPWWWCVRTAANELHTTEMNMLPHLNKVTFQTHEMPLCLHYDGYSFKMEIPKCCQECGRTGSLVLVTWTSAATLETCLAPSLRPSSWTLSLGVTSENWTHVSNVPNGRG